MPRFKVSLSHRTHLSGQSHGLRAFYIYTSSKNRMIFNSVISTFEGVFLARDWKSLLIVILPTIAFFLLIPSAISHLPYFMPITFASVFLFVPYTVLLAIFVVIAIKYHNDTNRKTLIVFAVSFFFSGYFWYPIPTSRIDYSLFAFSVQPVRILYSILSALLSYYRDVITIFMVLILTNMSFITTEILAIHSRNHINAAKTLLFLIMIVVLWCLMPSIIPLVDQEVLYTVSFPFGPLLAIGIVLSDSIGELELANQRPSVVQ